MEKNIKDEYLQGLDKFYDDSCKDHIIIDANQKKEQVLNDVMHIVKKYI